MSEQNNPLEALQDIRRMMERSSRFISLSGWSGIGAGICALVAAFYTQSLIQCWQLGDCLFGRLPGESGEALRRELFFIAVLTFAAAFVIAFFFTWMRSRKNGTPIWDATVRRLMWSVAVPVAVGGLLLFRMIQLEQYEFIAPGCLIFYGLALLNASKYTLGEIRYLGYGQLLLGIINLWAVGYGLLCWAIGFGVLHIIYGIWMWWKYERKG